MGTKTRQRAADLPKAEVGEIDTRAPFESVKAAVSLFGKGSFVAGKSAVREPKPQPAEKIWVQERRLHVAHKEVNKLKEELHSAETTRIQALTELESAKKTVELLTHKLNTINASKELALKVTATAKGQSKQLEHVSSKDGTAKEDSAWKQELDCAREQYTISIAELDAAKHELRRLRNDFDATMDAKICAYQQEARATQLSDANIQKAAELSKDITVAHESLMHVKLATEQAQQEEAKIHSEKDSTRQSYRETLEKTEKKLSSLMEEFDPELQKNFEMKLAETNTEIVAIQKEMKDARVLELESVTNLTTELDGAKGVLQKIAEEENFLKSLMESLTLELDAVRKEHLDVKEKDAEVESVAGNLHLQLAKCRADLEVAIAAESKTGSSSDELTSALQQLSAETEAALQEAEEMKKNAEQLKHEAEAARNALVEADKKLQAALIDAEEAKAAEAGALAQIKELSEKTSASRASTSEHGANITISVDEYDSLSRKVEESDKLTEMKVAAAMAQVDAVRSSEDEAIKRLETTRKEMEDLTTATMEAIKRAEMAEAAKKAVEGELKKWRETEQKKVAEAASRKLAETQMPKEQLPPRGRDPPRAAAVVNTGEKVEAHRKVYKPSGSKKKLLPSLSAIFQKRKSQVDGGIPSYLPGEKPV